MRWCSVTELSPRTVLTCARTPGRRRRRLPPGIDTSIGPGSTNLAIAAAKAGIIAIVFMHLFETEPLPRLAVAAAGLWLAILFGLTLADQWALRG